MRKTCIVLIVTVLCFGVISYGKGKMGMTSAATAIAPLSPMLVLDSSPTTGYSWNWMIDNENVVAVSNEYVPDNLNASQDMQLFVGGGGKDHMALSGLSAGESVITFTYKRPWEKNALYTLVYRVRVDEDLNVTILSTSFDW